MQFSPDPKMYSATQPPVRTDQGRCIHHPELETPELSGRPFPQSQKFIIDNQIRIFYLDGFKSHRAEATDLELQIRMQGAAFQELSSPLRR